MSINDYVEMLIVTIGLLVTEIGIYLAMPLYETYYVTIIFTFDFLLFILALPSGFQSIDQAYVCPVHFVLI